MTEIMFPVGRMVGGSLYRSQPRTDNNGKPIINNDGTPAVSFSFGVAYRKGAEQYWSQTPWGAQIKQIGETGYGAMANSPTFAWKITDGDSRIPNKKGRVPADQEGYAGHWIVWFSQGWAPKACNADGSQELTETDAIVPGYFVQVYADVRDNKPSQSPGVYINPIAVALSAYGERINTTTSVDTRSVGFGGGQLPPGASATPIGAMQPPASPVAGAQVPNTVPPVAAPAPNPAFLHVPVKTMTPKAAGATYEQFIQNGWTDDMMVQQGYLIIG